MASWRNLSIHEENCKRVCCFAILLVHGFTSPSIYCPEAKWHHHKHLRKQRSICIWQEINAQKSGKGWQLSQWEMEIEKSLKLLMDPVQFTISFGSRSMELSLVITKLLMVVTVTTEDKTFRPFTSQTLHTHTRLLKQGLRTRCGVRQNFANSCESDPTEWLRWRQLHKKHVMVVSPGKNCLQHFTKTDNTELPLTKTLSVNCTVALKFYIYSSSVECL